MDSTPESFYPHFPTMVDALRWWSEKIPERPAVIFLSDGENETLRLTYAELDREARRVAANLGQVMDPRSRALLCFPAGVDFLIAYFGCLYAGVIAVPVYAPANTRHLGRLAAIVADAGAEIALTDAETLSKVAATPEPPFPGLRWLAVDAVDAAGSPVADSWSPPAIAPADIAFLQYTSGSTGTPKGVVVAHENLATNIGMMGGAVGDHAGIQCVSWLPVYHDMGLIGCVLTPLWQGLYTVLMPPTAFLRRPMRWLRAISKYRATAVSSPNFGYELCCRQPDPEGIARLDLSSLRAACIGAEPIQPETMERFSRLFAPAGFRRSSFFPCYGLAEATLYVSGHHLPPEPGIVIDKTGFQQGKIIPVERDAEAWQAVSCGEPVTGQSVAIVDPGTMYECGPDEVGEIWLAGDHVAKGYWNDADATATFFEASLPTRPGTTFLRTGDLGFLHEGELFVTGRLKDIIIVFGRNYYPQDIEATVQAQTAIHAGGCVAFSLTNDGSEGVGIVAEVAGSHLRGDLTRVAEAVSQAVWDEHEVNVFQIVLLKAGGLPKTSSGKLRRRHTRDLMLADGLAEILRWPERRRRDRGDAGRALAVGVLNSVDLESLLLSRSLSDAEHFLLELVRTEAAVVLNLASQSMIDADRPLVSIGLDSLKAAELGNRLSTLLGLALPVETIRRRGTALELARAILRRSLLQITSQSGEPGTAVSSSDDDACQRESL